VHRILELMHQHEAKGTFFTLGWIAERYPKLVRLIAMEGHEIASHGYGHERASDQTPEAFLADIQLAKVVLEDIADCEVRGYRAPSFSVGYSNPWAHDCIETAGYAYSSSVYPVKHDHYGVPDAPRFPTRSPRAARDPHHHRAPFRPQLAGGRRWLLPPAALPGFGVGHPQGQRRRPSSGHLLLPPWEIDPGQPVVKEASAKTRFRHYVNLEHTEARLERLLQDFAWGRMDDVFLSATRI
jgi:polysaccharide deacetylase family protein (PEP-CTERM system associated)